MIRCPKTGRAISTGIRADVATFHATPVFFSQVLRPLCRLTHEWFAKDAWICECPANRRRGSLSLRKDVGKPAVCRFCYLSISPVRSDGSSNWNQKCGQTTMRPVLSSRTLRQFAASPASSQNQVNRLGSYRCMFETPLS